MDAQGDVTGQARQCLETIQAALAVAGAALGEIEADAVLVDG
ncbi:MAG: hypothetical protein ABI808_11415 [Pseudonocardiales bacterium]